MRVMVSREETVERRWDCRRCQARGLVHLRAQGESSRRVWWTSDDAEEEASDAAGAAMQHDAERMMAMIRCPVCYQRAPGAVVWSAVRLIWPLLAAVIFAGGAITAAILVMGWPLWVAPLIAVAALAAGTTGEVRRWRTALRAEIFALKPGTPQLPVAIALPGPPPAPLEPIRSAPPAAVAPAAAGDGPRFLTDRDGEREA